MGLDPGEIARVDVADDSPDPADCLPPGEEPLARAELSPGWVAVTDRELLAYRPGREPPLVRVPRPNVTGLSVRRAGARRVVGYVPAVAAGAVVALLAGGLLLAVDPTAFVTLPDAPGVEPVARLVGAFARGLRLLGTVLLFAGLFGLLSAAAAVGYWLLSRSVTLRVERGGADPVECPTTRGAGRRALRTLAAALDTDADGGGDVDAGAESEPTTEPEPDLDPEPAPDPANADADAGPETDGVPDDGESRSDPEPGPGTDADPD